MFSIACVMILRVYKGVWQLRGLGWFLLDWAGNCHSDLATLDTALEVLSGSFKTQKLPEPTSCLAPS